MFTEPTSAIFWATLVVEFLVAFGIITFLVKQEERQNNL